MKKNLKKNLWSLVLSKHTLVSVACTLVVVIAVMVVGRVMVHNHFRNMKQNPEAMIQHKVGKMAKHLNLNDSQIAQLQKLMLADFQTMKANRDALIAKRKSAMKSVLTPEQYAMWEKKMEKRMKKWQN